MIKQYGSRWNHDERCQALDDMNVMATMPAFVFGYIEERKEGLRVVSFFDVVGHRDRPIRGQGVTSMFNFGSNVGWWRGVLDSFGIPYVEVRPQKWMPKFSPAVLAAAALQVLEGGE